jgi:NAD(P)H-flavin reductase/ferredoxin
MTILMLNETPIEIAEGETVLSALLAAGVDTPYACQAGVCQTCLHQAVEGTVPEEAQIGLSGAQKAQGYFMACVCTPKGPLRIVQAGDLHGQIEVSVSAIDWLSQSVIRLRLEPDRAVSYRPGQFLALTAPGGVTRTYSIASHPDADAFIELHVRIIPNGRMSSLIAGKLARGDRLKISNPSGTCFYDGADPNRPIVLAGTGTGLAPLWGVLRDALAQNHRGPITLYHGARDQSGLYLVEDLRALVGRRENFSYRPCVLSASEPGNSEPESSDLTTAVIDGETDLANTDFYLCGGASLIDRLKRELFLKGAKLQRLRTDTFLPAS